MSCDEKTKRKSYTSSFRSAFSAYDSNVTKEAIALVQKDHRVALTILCYNSIQFCYIGNCARSSTSIYRLSRCERAFRTTGNLRYHSRRKGSDKLHERWREKYGCPRDVNEGAKLNVITAHTPRAESALATTVPFARIVYNSTIP